MIELLAVRVCVFPAYAGVILVEGMDNAGKSSIPRVCGGDPYAPIHKPRLL